MLTSSVVAWIWWTIKSDLGVESMADAEPAMVCAWAQERGIKKYLPPEYREAPLPEAEGSGL